MDAGNQVSKTLFTWMTDPLSQLLFLWVRFMKQFHIVVDSSKTYIKTERLEEYTSSDLEGTTALTKRERNDTRTVNEIADTYFKGDLL